MKKILYLFYGDAGGNETAGLGVVIEAEKSELQPVGNRGATARGETQHLRKTRHGQDSRHDGDVDSRAVAPIAKAQERVEIVEELRDRA